MTDKEMIEEIAKYLNITQPTFWSDCLKVAQYLVEKQGYRKIPEGSVVLSLQEHENDIYAAYNRGYRSGSQEKVSEIVNLPDSDILVVDTQEYGEIEVVSIERLQELAKQFGVELEE